MDERHARDGASTLDSTPVSQRLVSGDAVLELHDASRFIALSCVAPGRVTEADARAFAPHVITWIDGLEGPIYILVDCTEIRSTDAGWRSVLFETLAPRRHRLRIAWFGVNSLILIVARMFITALSTTSTFDGKILKERDAALRWLERDVS